MGAATRLSIVLALAALTSPAVAPAHDWSRSFSSWDLIADGARVRLSISELDLSRLPPQVLGEPRGIDAYVSGRLRMLAGGIECTAAGVRRLAAAPGTAVYEWSIRCPRQDGWEIRTTLLREVAPSHLHFVRVRLARGALVERVLSGSSPDWHLDASRSADTSGGTAGGASVAGYVKLGVEHVAAGWDHVAFLLALVLLATTLGELVGVATAFTVAHSLTLCLAVLGMVRPEAAIVEALVGFSIALVAAENAWILAGRGGPIPIAVVTALVLLALLAAQGVGAVPAATFLGLALFSACHFALLRRVPRSMRLRSLVAFAFGLVHGCAFAAVLGELELPRARLAPALFGFNAGVEIGQLLLIIAVWPLLLILGRHRGGRIQRWIMEGGSAGICALGVFWFLTRTFG
jgi:hypothetical protein